MNHLAGIPTRRVERCPICAAPGVLAHEALTDQLFGSSGVWRMRKCSVRACEHHWLDPAPTAESLPLLYDTYYTHRPPASIEDAGFLGKYEQALLAIAAQDLSYALPRVS